MGEMITKPDANPIVIALLNGFICGIPVGYFMIGQSKKGIAGLIYTWLGMVILSVCTLGMGGFLAFAIPLVFAYDGYLIGQKLQAGESIGDTENGLDFLNALPGFN